MGWGDGAWGEDRWGGDSVVIPLSASGRGVGQRPPKSGWSDGGWGDEPWGGGVGTRLSVVSTLAAAGSGVGLGSALLNAIKSASATGRGVGRGNASFSDLWDLGGVPFLPGDISIDAETVSLSATLDDSQLSTLRSLGVVGDVEQTGGFGGQFHAFDDAGSAAVSLQPGIETSPAVDPTDVLLAGISETDLGAGAPQQVDIELQRETNRSEVYGAISQSGDIELDLDHGTVGLDGGDVGLIDREQTTVGNSASLSLLVSVTQLGALADTLGYPDGVVERSVPNGEDFVADESPDSTQTVSLSTASGVDLDLDDGDYIVRDWSASQYSQSESHRYQIEMTLQPTS